LVAHVNALQIPAFLCRQTNLLLAAGASGLAVNVKKGQWMAPEEMRHPVDKLRAAGATDLAVTERGTAFGYGRWVVDMRGFALMREATGGARVVFDATHSVQLPAGAAGGGASGGEPRHIGALARAAVAAGAEGLFVEVHPEPAAAPSDGPNVLQLDGLEALVTSVLAMRQARLEAGEP
ncbi:MAG: 3-deoxy-8-phosphooctulonate synthase, partial [Gemmatimonadota bacterium]